MALTAREKNLVGGLGVLVVFVMGWMFLLQPAWEETHKSWTQMSQAGQEIKTLQTQQGAVQKEIQQMESQLAAPNSLHIRTYKEDIFEKSLKEMIDQIVALAADNGNELISLEPYQIDSAADRAKEGNTQNQRRNKKKKGPAAQAQAPTTAEETANTNRYAALMTYGYEMAIRGSYPDILKFLNSLNSHDEMIEISSITLENEGNSERALPTDASQPTHQKADKPIKLTARLKLFLLRAYDSGKKSPQ